MTFSTWYSIGNSAIHRWHPATKLLFTIVMWLTAFIIQQPILNALQFLILLGLISLARVPSAKVIGFTKVTSPIVLAYFLLWPFLFGGGPVLLSVILPGTMFEISVYEFGLVWGAIAAFRLATVFYSTFLLLATTSDSQVIQGLVSMKFPYIVAFVLMITTRFLATLMSDMSSIQEARRARGLSQRVGLSGFIRNLSSILIPLVMVSMRRVQILSDAIEVRAFATGRNRTSLNYVGLGSTQKVSILGIFSFFALVIYLRFGVGVIVTFPSRI